MLSIPSLASQTFDAIEPVLVSPMEEGFWRGSLRVLVLVRLDGCIEAAPLAEGLRRLQRRHPKLRAVMTVGSDGRGVYHFDQETPAIPCEITEYQGVESPWREASERLLRIEPPPRGPLVVVTVLRNRASDRSELILSVHHGVADGRSAVTLVHDLLTEHRNVQTGSPALPALPVASGATARFSGRWLDRLRLIRRFVHLQRQEGRLRHTALPEAGDVTLSSQWVHWVFSREDTLKIVRSCRKHQVIPSGVLVAAVCCGLMECLPVGEAVFKWICPFDVREMVEGRNGPITTADLGNFVASMRGLYTLPQPPAFWQVATQVHRDIQDFVKQGGPALGYNLARFALGARFRRLEAALPKPIERPTLFFTNQGVISLHDAYGNLRPRECTFMFKGDNASRPWLTLEALIMGDRLNLGLAGDGLEPAFWEQLYVAVRRHLNSAVGIDDRLSSSRS